jgi:uncharacterized protein YjiS (DUF1127 family)
MERAMSAMNLSAGLLGYCRFRRSEIKTLIRLWSQRSYTRYELRHLDESSLRDIGLTRSEAESEAAKPFWQGDARVNFAKLPALLQKP